MSYTKAEMVDQVYLKVTGGQPSGDVNVKRVDIAKYLSAALEYVIVKDARERRREAQLERSVPQTVTEEFLSTYKVAVQEDTERDLSYVVSPKKVLSLPMNMGYAEMTPLDSKNQFIKVRSYSEIQGAEEAFAGTTIYWLERYNDENRLYIYNLGHPVDNVLIKVVVSPDDIDDEDVLQIPSGLDVEVIRLCEEFFTGQRRLPGDLTPDNRDEQVEHAQRSSAGHMRFT